MPALNVRFVETEKSIGVERDKLTVEAPRFMARMLELLETRAGAVSANPAVLNVPLVTVTALFVAVKAEPRSHTPPTPLNVTALASETPLVVMVFPLAVEVKLIPPARVQVVPECSVILPAMLKVPPVPA